MYLKYTLKNIKFFFIDNWIIFILLIISVITSSIVIFFAYGVYQNYNTILNYKEDDSYDDYIWVDYENTNSEYVTKEDLMNCLSEIDRISNGLQEQIVQYNECLMIIPMNLSLYTVMENSKLRKNSRKT